MESLKLHKSFHFCCVCGQSDLRIINWCMLDGTASAVSGAGHPAAHPGALPGPRGHESRGFST